MDRQKDRRLAVFERGENGQLNNAHMWHMRRKWEVRGVRWRPDECTNENRTKEIILRNIKGLILSSSLVSYTWSYDTWTCCLCMALQFRRTYYRPTCSPVERTQSGLKLSRRRATSTSPLSTRAARWSFVSQIHCWVAAADLSPIDRALNRLSRVSLLRQTRWTDLASRWPWNSWPLFTFDRTRLTMTVGISRTVVGWLINDVIERAASTRWRWWLLALRPRRWRCRCENDVTIHERVDGSDVLCLTSES